MDGSGRGLGIGTRGEPSACSGFSASPSSLSSLNLTSMAARSGCTNSGSPGAEFLRRDGALLITQDEPRDDQFLDPLVGHGFRSPCLQGYENRAPGKTTRVGMFFSEAAAFHHQAPSESSALNCSWAASQRRWTVLASNSSKDAMSFFGNPR